MKRVFSSGDAWIVLGLFSLLLIGRFFAPDLLYYRMISAVAAFLGAGILVVWTARIFRKKTRSVALPAIVVLFYALFEFFSCA